MKQLLFFATPAQLYFFGDVISEGVVHYYNKIYGKSPDY